MNVTCGLFLVGSMLPLTVLWILDFGSSGEKGKNHLWSGGKSCLGKDAEHPAWNGEGNWRKEKCCWCKHTRHVLEHLQVNFLILFQWAMERGRLIPSGMSFLLIFHSSWFFTPEDVISQDALIHSDEWETSAEPKYFTRKTQGNWGQVLSPQISTLSSFPTCASVWAWVL